MTTSHSVTLVNLRSGPVEGHRAGCTDLTRKSHRHADDAWTFNVDTKLDAWGEYNSDFINECEDDTCDHDNGKCSNSYEIHWLPCADHVPSAPVVESSAAAAPVVTVKVNRKQTIINVDGVAVAWVVNEHAQAVAVALAAL